METLQSGDLKEKNGEIKTEDGNKAGILNDFFTSVFTVEGDSYLQDFEQTNDDDNSLNAIDIIPKIF